MADNAMDALLSGDDDDDCNINAEDEEKLLEDDNLSLGKNSENEEPEDVLDLEVTEEFEDDYEQDDRRGSNIDTSFKKGNRNGKFINERPSPIRIEREEQVTSTQTIPKRNYNQRFGDRGRGRFGNRGNAHHRRGEKKTIYVNRHFQGNVQVSNNALLKFHNNVASNRQPMARVAPWQNDRNMPQHSVNEPPPFYQPPPVQNVQPIMQNFNPQQLPMVMGSMQQSIYPQTFLQNRYVQQAPPMQPLYQPQIQLPPAQQQQPLYPPSAPLVSPPPVPMYNNYIPQQEMQQCVPVNPHISYNPAPEQNYVPQYPPQNSVYNQPLDSRHVSAFEEPRQFRSPQKTMQNKEQFNQKRRFGMKHFDTMKKKKRIVDTTNLQEVKITQDLPPDSTTQDQEAPEVDEATREYLKQIELQKKKREEFLRQKEERRRQKMLAEAAVAAPSQPVTVERKAIETLTTTSRDFKVKKPTPLSNANRIVVAPNDDNLVTVKNAQNSNPFLNNRTVLAKDQDLVSTPVVVVNNLSAGTTEGKIRKLCSGIGEVKKLDLSPVQRQATIEFKSVASAHAFYKKYQRFMLDLSMIQVDLQRT